MIIRTKAFPRAALIGNPSDGYFGKTIAFVFSNYNAEVQLYESPELDLLPSLRDHSSFKSIDHLAKDVGMFGYYGGIRLLKATIKKFHEYCQHNAIELDDRNFTIRYQTTIPNRLGLAGSSAIITACIRALKRFYDVKIPKPILANLVLSVEREELGIDAGLQDRVAQSYNVPVHMDFDRDHMNEHGYGIYKEIELPDFLNLYIAFRTDLSEGSEILHGHLREDYEKGRPKVLAAMKEWAELTDKVLDCMEESSPEKLHKLINRNYDLREKVCSTISPRNKLMVNLAREAGASAKFTGSGGAIIGTYRDETTFGRMKERLNAEDIQIIKPRIVTSSEEAFQ